MAADRPLRLSAQSTEHRPPPPVTIEGGPGWQLESVPDDAVGDDSPRRLPRPSRTVVVAVLAAVAGFGAAALLADLRTQTLAESDAGTLSIDVRPEPDSAFFELTETADGRLGTSLVLSLLNEGPRTVALQAVDVPGSGYAAEGVAGRRLEPRSITRITLRRPLDCAADLSPRLVIARPVRVRASTDAGTVERLIDVPVAPFQYSEDVALPACGDLPASQSLLATDVARDFAGASAQIDLELRNVSRRPLTLRAVRPLPGLAVELLDRDGAAVRLPLRLAAGDFSQPRPPFDMSLPATLVTVRLSVTDCGPLARPPGPYDGPYAEVDVDSDGDGGTTFLGSGFAVLPRLRAAAC